jgi:uncharacterized membrane protein YhaH (DUF805 family)
VEPVRVPQHLELEDVVAWGLSASDLVFVVAGCALAWWLYLVLPGPFALRVAAAVPVLASGLALGIARLRDRALRGWLLLLAAYLLRARRLVSGESR